MPSDRQPPPATEWNMAGTFDIIYVAFSVIAMAFYPFLHTGMGHCGIGWFGLWAVIYMWGFADLAPCPLIYPYIAAWCVAAVFQQFVKDGRAHSHYNGWPILCRLPFMGREGSGRALEGVLLMCVGFLLAPVDPNLSGFFLIGWIAIMGKEAMDRCTRQAAVRRMRDHEILQRRTAEDYHGGY